MGTAASTRPQPKGPQPTGQTTAVPTAFVVAEKYEEPAVAGVLVQHPSAEPIVHGVPVAFSPTAAAVHTGAVVHTATTAHAGAAAHPADPGEIPVNVNTMKSVEWICIEANTPYPFQQQRLIEKAYRRYVRDNTRDAHCEVIGGDNKHYMILFKSNNVFAEMDVLTGRERVVQRREVVQTISGLGHGGGLGETAAEREARELVESISSLGHDASHHDAAAEREAREFLRQSISSLGHGARHAETAAERDARELAQLTAVHQRLSRPMTAERLIVEQAIAKSAEEHVRKMSEDAQLERARKASLISVADQRAREEQARKLAADEANAVAKAQQASLLSAHNEQMSRVVQDSFASATHEHMAKVREDHVRQVSADDDYARAREASAVSAANEHLARNEEVPDSVHAAGAFLFDMVKRKADPQEILSNAQSVFPDPHAMVQLLDRDRNTLMMVAAQSHHVAFVTTFGSYTDLGSSNNRGDTCLHLACLRSTAQAYQTVSQLMKLGAPLEATNLTGDTPLHCAVAMGSSPVVAMMVEAGASITAHNYKDQTPLDIASARGLAALAEVMRATARNRAGNSEHDNL